MYNLSNNCSDFDRYVIKNVVGIAISTIIHYPICSDESDICGKFNHRTLKHLWNFFLCNDVLNKLTLNCKQEWIFSKNLVK